MPIATNPGPGGIPSAIGTGLLLPGQPGAAGGPGGPASPYAGSGWEVTVLAAPGYYQQLAKLPPRMVTGVQFVMQLNDKGSGTITLSMDDAFWQTTLPGSLAAHNLLDYEHLWQVWQDGILRFEFLGETVTEQLVDPSEQRVATVTGPGSIAALAWGMAAPPGFPNIIYKLDAISDGFAEVNTSGQLVLDTGLWNESSPVSHISLNPSGTCQIMASPGTTYLGTNVFDATETLISAQVAPMVSPNAAGSSLDGSQVTQFYIQDVGNSANYFLMGMTSTSLYAKLGDPAGVQTQVISTAANYATVMSNNQGYGYWQLSEHAGYFIAWTSPDGTNWTQQWKVRHTWTPGQVGFFVTAAYDVDNTQFATITSLNSNVTTSSLAGAIYRNQPIMSVWMAELRAAQRRGTIPFITTRMSPGHDSFGNVFTDSVSVQVANGTDLYSLLQGHCSMINADFRMDPGFTLVVGTPQSGGAITLGTDRSQGIIFREARGQTAKTRTRTRNAIANLIAAINSDGRTVTASNPTSESQWGQREGWIQAAVQVTPADIDMVAAASVEETSSEQLAWTMQITPNQPGQTVFRDFAVGDWVGLERPDYSAIDAVRVIAIAVQYDTAGVETHELTLVSYLQWLQEQLTYVVNKLGGSLLSVAGTTPVAGGISNLTQPTVFAPTLAGLADVNAASVAGNAPLVWDPVSGAWVPAGTVNPDTGSTANITIVNPGGAATTVAATGTTVAAQSGTAATAGDSATPGVATPTAQTVTTPNGTVVYDGGGVQRVVIGQQSDGTFTHTTVNAPAPQVPDTPGVVGAALGVIVTWDGLLSGAGPLSDFSLVQVHGSTASGFTPGSATLQGTMAAGGLFGVGGLAAGTPYYVKLVAVSRSGSASAPSAQGTATPNTIASSITAGSLPGTAIQTGTITSAQISAAAGIMGSQLASNAGIVAGQVAFTAQSIGGGPVVTVASTAPGSPNTNDLWFDGSNAYQLKRWTGTAWTAYQFGTQAIAANSVTAAQIAAATITAAQIATGTITATQIQAGTITANQIAANTLTAGLFQAGIVLAGIINGTVVTGSTIQNSSSNPRTSINPDGSITITNVAGVTVFRIGPDGTIYWYTQGGQLLMELQPGGTQVIYATPTGPSTWDYEPAGGTAPIVLFSASSAASATAYANTVGQAVSQGQVITVVASASGASAASAVTDSKGNTYTLQRSVTTNQYVQVFTGTASSALVAGTDTITVTYGAANTQQKNLIALATPGILTATADFTNASGGTGTSATVSGTPTSYNELLYFIVTDATAGGAPSAVTDGWVRVAQQNVSGSQWTSVYYSASISSAAVAPAATIASASWSGIILGLAQSPAAPLTGNAPAGTNATLAVSTAWAGDGNFSLKVTHSNTTSGWGATIAAFPVTGGGLASMQALIYAPAALSAISVGFTFWTGANGTGTRLGTVSGDQGTFAAASGTAYQVSITGATVPATAQSATFFVSEGAADAVNTVYYIDDVQVPGGLVYSNAPVPGSDVLGNPIQQGINFVGLPGLTNVFGVESPWGTQLATIDSSGNMVGSTLSSTGDILLAGNSLSAWISSLPLGVVARGYTPGSSGTPWPGTAFSSETALLEVDYTLPPGRAIDVDVRASLAKCATAAQLLVMSLKYTIDGSVPTTSSQLAAYNNTDTSFGTANQFCPSNPLHVNFQNTTGSAVLYRFLVTSKTTSGTCQFYQPVELDVTDVGLAGAPMSQNGLVLGSGTSGGNGTQVYSLSYWPPNSYTYWDSGVQRNRNSTMYVGNFAGNVQYVYLDCTTLAAAIPGGATIISGTFRLQNQWTYYAGGCTLAVWCSSSLGAGSGSFQSGPSAPNSQIAYSEGQLKTHTGGDMNQIIANLIGSYPYMVLAANPWNSSSEQYNAYYYGAGGSGSQSPMLTINYSH